MDLLPALTIQRAVVFALFVRELKTRFGTYRLGYFWALLEPLAHIAVILTIFGIRSKRIIPGIDFPVFLITGLVPFFMFRNIVLRLMNAVDANKGLFNYKQVKPLDALIARLILEGVIYLFVFVLFISAAGLLGYDISIPDPLGLMAIFAMVYLFSFGLGIIACIMFTLYTESKKFIPILIHPLYIISAVLFPMNAIPQQYQKWFLWNPLVHAMELLRTSFFASFRTETGDIFYLVAWTISVLMLGLSVYWIKRTEMLASA